MIKPDPVGKKVGTLYVVTDERMEKAAKKAGIIVSVGPQAWHDLSKNGEPWAKPGDYVYYVRYSGQTIKDPLTGEVFVLLHDKDVIAHIDMGENPKFKHPLGLENEEEVEFNYDD